ncbi:MAG: hypothetical protein WCA56_07610 [Xanthobacteraceae bacterium]|jgi:hypothetical protein
MSDVGLRAEIEALRREIAAMRAEQAPGAKPDETMPELAAEPGAGNFTDQLHALAREIAAFAEDPEKGVVNHPLTSVLGALVLGILIGRVIHR